MSGSAQIRRTGPPRLAFAGDRDVAVAVLEHLLASGAAPLALLVSHPDRASHAHELRRRCAMLPDARVLEGDAFRTADGMTLLRELDLDFVIGVHFPYLVPDAVLAIPREGVLNLHPAFLPYNRGWHTPSWAILDESPIGATLHFMDAGLDTGDIVHQRRLEPDPGDTADTLYQRLKAMELQVFEEAWPSLAAGRYERRPQTGKGSLHRRRDLFAPGVQEIDLSAATTAGALLRRLRALTTNRVEEAAYFESGGVRYRVQVHIRREEAAAD